MNAESGAIVFRDLVKTYDDVEAVKGVSLVIPAGQICGYLGPNGAGKSTTVKLATGMLRPTSGTALIEGFDIALDPIEAKRRIGVVPETGALYENLTAREYLTLVSRLYHVARDEAGEKIGTLLRLFGIADVEDRVMSSYSKGMKQRVVISAALIHNPSVLFLDEPLSGLDANTALVLKELVRELAAQGENDLLLLARARSRREGVPPRRHPQSGDDHSRRQRRRAEDPDEAGIAFEEVFSELTSTGDLAEIVRAFSESVTGEHK